MMKLATVLQLLKYLIWIWRFCRMYKQTMNVVKGLGVGVLAGTVAAAIGTKAMSGGRRKAAHMKKTAGKAIHTMGNLIGDVEKMLR